MNVLQITFDAIRAASRGVEKWEEPWLPWFHESYLAFVVGHALLDAGASYVVPEVKPPDYPKSERCDLFARSEQHGWFFEMKKGYHGVGAGWNTKPGAQLGGWLWDVVKLLRLKDAASHRVFAMIHYRQHDLSAKAIPFVVAEIDGFATAIATHLQAGGTWDTLPLPPGDSNSWLAIAIMEATLRRLGKVLVTDEPFLGTDFEKEGKIMEHRFVVGCF